MEHQHTLCSPPTARLRREKCTKNDGDFRGPRGHQKITPPKKCYCWWFRNRANQLSPGEYRMFHWVLYIPGGCLGILNHQPYVIQNGGGWKMMVLFKWVKIAGSIMLVFWGVYIVVRVLYSHWVESTWEYVFLVISKWRRSPEERFKVHPQTCQWSQWT